MKEKSILCVFLKICFKNNVKPAHWVGHSQLRFLDTNEFFKRTPVVDEKQASVTVNIVKQSVSGGGERIRFHYKKKNKMYLKRLIMILI